MVSVKAKWFPQNGWPSGRKSTVLPLILQASVVVVEVFVSLLPRTAILLEIPQLRQAGVDGVSHWALADVGHGDVVLRIHKRLRLLRIRILQPLVRVRHLQGRENISSVFSGRDVNHCPIARDK